MLYIAKDLKFFNIFQSIHDLPSYKTKCFNFIELVIVTFAVLNAAYLAQQGHQNMLDVNG